MTLVAFFLIWSLKDWRLSYRELRHSYYGVLFLGLSLIMIVLGIASWLVRRMSPVFETRKVTLLKKVHTYFAYFICLFIQLAVCSGIMVRVLNSNQSTGPMRYTWLVLANVLLILFVMGWCEI